MSSTMQTRRSTTNDEDTSANHRTLSERIRGLFRKKSSSPTRSTVSSKRQSLSSESVHVSTEAPHLRAPNINWSLGRKRGKEVETSSTISKNSKLKDSRKSKKKGASALDISYPVPESEEQTFIQGQHFVPKTPESTRQTTGRTHSSSSYETATRGFRDFSTTESPKIAHQVVASKTDAPARTSYISHRSHSPSITPQYDSSSPPLSDSEVFSTLHRHEHEKYSSLPNNREVVSPLKTPNDSDQWKKTSSSSLNKTEPTVDVPKFRTPTVTFGSTTSRKENKRADLQSSLNGSYHSSPTINNVTHSNSSGSSPDSDISQNDDVNLSKHDSLKYPGLSAILEHHFRPTTLYPTARPQRTVRYDTSTTTLADLDEPQIWSTNNSIRSISSARQKDGFIRPLTPHTFVDPRLPVYSPLEESVIYRSSTIIYTKDKRSYADGGAILMWSVQENDEHNTNRKAFAAIQLERQLSMKSSNGLQHSPRSYEHEEDKQYYNQSYYFAQPANIIDKDNAYIQGNAIDHL